MYYLVPAAIPHKLSSKALQLQQHDQFTTATSFSAVLKGIDPESFIKSTF